ncbi:hypothetical protein [Streptomyces sp. ME19-01-6]|uniref:hypothetical protein n=1 Tax=Streptomyces sp. ME19-01-6 TaxID=3028686 RepID=UPI0029A08422|nr:hypothetical protein [Streptomyces sp. ME19-01-6]MDX3225615.1 hypothetical protein [Streptomyces sp. ME19-01-6]
MTIDLSLLETAATKWDEAAKKFEAVQKIYDSKVKSVGLDGSWTGWSQLVAGTNMQVTDQQFTAAPKEARAIASILRDAHAQFVELRGKVKSAVADAVKAGMKVSDTGTASYDFSKVSASEANAVRYQAKVHEAEVSWTRLIQEAVKAVDDADQGVKLALKAAVADPNPVDAAANGFNGKAEGDIEKVEGEEAKELATKLNSDGKLSDKELAEFQRLVRDNQHDKVFSQTFLDGVGLKGTIQLNNKFNSLAKGDDEKDFRALQEGVATSLATATQSPSDPFYKKWREGLRKVGDDNFGKNTNPLYGYQSFVNLMTHGKNYGKQFLHDVGNDIIALEKSDKLGSGRWTQWGAGHKDVATDPLDSLLGIMGRQPDVATSFLDPGTDGKADNLTYLLKDREWPKQSTAHAGGVFNMDLPGSRLGLGAALEAGATGNVPGTDYKLGYHTDAEARIMRDTIKILDEGRHGADLHPNLRSSMAGMLVDYTPETHEILTRTGMYMDKDGVWNDGTSDPKDAHMSVSRESLTRIMRGVAEDGQAFREMYDAESFYSAGTLSQTDFNNPNDRAAAIEGASSVFGFYDGLSSDIARDKKDDAVSWANHVQTGEFVVTGGLQAGAGAGASLAGKGPGIGFATDVAYRILYAGTYDWKEDQIAQATQAAAADTEYHFTTGQKQVNALAAGWAKENGHGPDSGLSRHLIGSGQERYDSARTEALIYLDG